MIQELGDNLAASNNEAHHHYHLSSLIDIAMEFIEPGMELRQGDSTQDAKAVRTFKSRTYTRDLKA